MSPTKKFCQETSLSQVLSVRLLQPLDFETKKSFSLRIEATNRNIDSNFLSLGPFSDTTSIKVTVEDVNEPPVFHTPLTRMVVSEDAKVDTSIGRVSAHDPDTSNNAIRYLLSSFNSVLTHILASSASKISFLITLQAKKK